MNYISNLSDRPFTKSVTYNHFIVNETTLAYKNRQLANETPNRIARAYHDVCNSHIGLWRNKYISHNELSEACVSCKAYLGLIGQLHVLEQERPPDFIINNIPAISHIGSHL